MDLVIEKLNDTYIKIHCEDGIARELHENFSFSVPGFRFMPSFKKGWNGKIRLFNLVKRTIYFGLLHHITEWCEANEYTYHINFPIETEIISEASINEWVASLNLPIVPRDYQLKALYYNIKNKRAITLSPTGSGKSLLLYLLARWFNKKTLIIVPTTGLVHQLSEDFRDYGYKENIHEIYEGRTKTPIFVTFELLDGSLFTVEGSVSIPLLNNKENKKQAKDILPEDEIDDRWLQTINCK